MVHAKTSRKHFKPVKVLLCSCNCMKMALRCAWSRAKYSTALQIVYNQWNGLLD